MAKSIRILLAIAAWYDYEIWQMDVKTAFLNVFVEEEIFMDQLEGFTYVGEEQKVCRLQRSIYSLKQASQSWNTHFDEVIRGYNIKNEHDPCIYNKISGSSVAYLVIYVDDILLKGTKVDRPGTNERKRSEIQSSCARDCRDYSSLRTTPVLSELGIQVIPTKPPRLPYDDPAIQFSQFDTLSIDPLRSHRRPTSVIDETRHSFNECDSRCPFLMSLTWNISDPTLDS
ncbi:UNVERIFIED_CONTAM: hypothetical protein Slati_0184900 [Sesamum latifolium]|uniref:Reverse transcriptase Ty1/copia-type domain-containing protein n=1 Tax=Sesamum latifolium TaxID=2727402 RepID=A0AAW2YAS7_9LAMI